MSTTISHILPSVTKEVIVLIPHYNNYSGLKMAIQNIKESISYDILIVDDGSTIEKIDIEDLKASVGSHSGLSILEMAENRGIEHALNNGLQYIKQHKYEFIARLDCDDRCRQSRLEKQILFLREHKDLAIVGTQIQFINKLGDPLYKIKLPTEDQDIRSKMYLNAMLIHPTIMFRTSILETIDGYPIAYEAAEDYAFYWEILKNYKMANLEAILVDCIIDEDGISTLRRDKQLQSRMRLIKENFRWGIYPIMGLVKTYIAMKVPFNTLLKLKKMTYGH